MSKQFLPNQSLPPFLEALAGYGELHGPVLTEDAVPSLRRITNVAELSLDISRTLLPPKKYLLPPRETILTYTEGRGYEGENDPKGNIVLFGIHPCDLAAIAYLDKIFMAGVPDHGYTSRRNAVTLIGVSCKPDEFCFCGELGASVPRCFDLFMQRSADGFLMVSGSSRGTGILANVAPLLTEHVVSQAVCIESEYGLLEIIRQVAARLETFPDNDLWDDFAERCLSCGACSLCCPTCYCFDVRENGSLDGKSAERLREWDNCLFKTHGEVTGGFNFRKSRKDRFHYRFLHKYLGFGPVRGVVSCVGCGRCKAVCPVGIDLLELFRQEEVRIGFQTSFTNASNNCDENQS